MSEALAVYRALLKAINRNITFATGNRLWLEHAREEFRRHRGAADSADAAQLLQLAKDYIFTIDGVREHTELLRSYNVGIPLEDRERNMNKRAAELVGLAMPPPPEAEADWAPPLHPPSPLK